MIKNKKKSLLSLILCVAFLCASFLATLPLFRTIAPTYAVTKSVTWNSTEQGYANAEVLGEVQVNDDITLTFDKAGAGNAPTYYTADGGSVRVYASGALKVKGATNVSITKIVITYGSGDKSNSVSANVGNFDGSTWTGETNEVTFTIGGGTSGHRRFKILEITYNGGASHEHGTIVDTWDAVEPTCTGAGNLAAYQCDCGLWFEDEACTIEIGDDDDLLYWCMEGGDGYLAPLGHDFEHAYVEYKETYMKSGTWFVWADLVCGRGCGEVIKSEKATAGYVKDSDATCTEPEKGHRVATFTDPDFPAYAAETGSVTQGEPLGHTDVGATVEYSWSGNTCTATKRCGRCHEISNYETKKGEYVRDTDPTCLNNARGHYEVTFTEDWVTVKTQSSTHGAIEEPGSALGHDDEHATIKYFWSGDMCTASKCCGRCGTPLESETKKADYVKDTGATCQHNEKGHYTVTFAIITTETKSTGANSVEIADTKVEHTASAVEYTWEDDQCTATIHCTVCHEELDHETVTAEHVVDTPSTDCKTNAKGHYKATFTRLSTATKATPANSVEFEGTQKPQQFNNADVKYTWFGQYCTATVKCSNCDETLAETVLGEEVVDTPASCQSNKKGHYTATFTKFASTSTDTNSVDFPDTKLPHE
ncbi:MAG: hypothetical protein MJ152_00020 [Clostridia bacterium]|nr:hypothetical protein [Clostridia bacterium]